MQAAATRGPARRRVWLTAAALFPAALCAWLAWHHPLSGIAALAACALIAGMAFMAPQRWALWLLPILPVAGLMTWTGWLIVEEFDLAVLATVAGAYARLGIMQAKPRSGPRLNVLALLGLLLYGAALAVSTARGWTQAPATPWSWWQGYHEPLNSLRVAKGFALAMLILPLALHGLRQDAVQASTRLIQGMAGMLGVVALMALWERLAFTGLLNFSTDYRTTALFWEMHVGGAALDAVLALSMPFVAAALALKLGARQWLVWAAVAAGGAYASLTTFSRIVYVAVPVALLIWFVLQRRGDALRRAFDARLAPPPASPVAPAPSHMTLVLNGLPAAMLVLVFTALAAWLFAGSGYRGMLALLLAVAVLLPLASMLRRLNNADLLVGALGGLTLAACACLMAAVLPKGAYIAEALAAASAAVLLLLLCSGSASAWVTPRGAAVLLLALSTMLAAGVATVSNHWGNAEAARRGLWVAVGIALAPGLLLIGQKAAWPASWRWQASMAGVLAGVALLVGVASGGDYMSGRWSSFRSDLVGRESHWTQSINSRTGVADGLFGKGTGRYPDAFMDHARLNEIPGDYRWLDDAQGRRLALSGGRHILGWGEILRISQRIEVPQQPSHVTLQARSAQPASLHVEVCEKHLLYNNRCVIGKAALSGKAGEWQILEVPLAGEWPLSRGAALTPRLIVFSVALESSGNRAEVKEIQLVSGDGRSLLQNGNFEQGLAHWYFSSDRNHLPWHAKNVVVHLLVEQGSVGVLLFAVLLVSALWRLGSQRLNALSMAAPMAAGLIGALVVGSADSLLDIPRVSFLCYLAMGVGLLATGLLSTGNAGQRMSAL